LLGRVRKEGREAKPRQQEIVLEVYPDVNKTKKVCGWDGQCHEETCVSGF